MRPSREESRVAQHYFSTANLCGCVPPTPATDKAVGKLKRQMFFKKKPLQFRGDVCLNFTFWHGDLIVFHLLVEVIHVSCQMAIEALAEIENFIPPKLQQNLFRTFYIAWVLFRSNPSNTLEFSNNVAPALNIFPNDKVTEQVEQTNAGAFGTSVIDLCVRTPVPRRKGHRYLVSQAALPEQIVRISEYQYQHGMPR